MKVFHFIPNLKAVDTTCFLRYKASLIRTMSDEVDVHVLTSESSAFSLGNAVIHKYSPLKVYLAHKCRDFDRLLADIRPDVVHIHACWTMTAYKLLKSCERCRMPVVLSVDRQLEAWHVKDKYFCIKLPKLIVYQRYIIRNSICLHVVNSQEREGLLSFGWHPNIKARLSLNKNVITIQTFGFEDATFLRHMTEELLRLYQKVIDSNPFWMMKEEEVHAEDMLLNAGLTYGHNSKILTEDDVNKINKFTAETWRRIILHSSDQNILDFVLAGAKLNGISVPSLQPGSIERFPADFNPNGDTELTENETAKTLMSDDAIPPIERHICITILTVLSKIKNRQALRSDLASLYKAIRFNNFDEALICKKIQEFRISKRTARLLQILSERYGLEEGFMFTEPLNDKETNKIRKVLFKSNMQ